MTDFEVGITGSGPHFGQLAQMARHASPDPFVWTGEGGTTPDWAAAAVGFRKISEPMDISKTAKVFGGYTGIDGNFSYPLNESIRPIGATHHIVRHPAAMADVMRMDYSGRFVACGFPGSGNGIVQAMLEAIQSINPNPPAHEGAIALAAAYAAGYWQLVDAELGKFDSILGAASHPAATYRESTASVSWDVSDDNRSTLLGLPMRNHLWEVIHKTHEPFGSKLRAMVCGGANCVLTVRNPLDTLVSIANKMAGGGVDLLGTDWLYRLVACGLTNYYKSFLPAIDNKEIQVVTYEECQGSFERVAQLLASKFGFELADQEICNLKERLLNKLLFVFQGDSRHLWRPDQTEKWRSYLENRHFEIAEQEGLYEILEEFGYSKTINDLSTKSPKESMAVHPTRSVGGGFFAHCIENSPENFGELRRLGLVTSDVGDKLIFMSNNSDVSKLFDSYLQEADLMALVRAGRFVE